MGLLGVVAKSSKSAHNTRFAAKSLSDLDPATVDGAQSQTRSGGSPLTTGGSSAAFVSSARRDDAGEGIATQLSPSLTTEDSQRKTAQESVAGNESLIKAGHRGGISSLSTPRTSVERQNWREGLADPRNRVERVLVFDTKTNKWLVIKNFLDTGELKGFQMLCGRIDHDPSSTPRTVLSKFFDQALGSGPLTEVLREVHSYPSSKGGFRKWNVYTYFVFRDDLIEKLPKPDPSKGQAIWLSLKAIVDLERQAPQHVRFNEFLVTDQLERILEQQLTARTHTVREPPLPPPPKYSSEPLEQIPAWPSESAEDLLAKAKYEELCRQTQESLAELYERADYEMEAHEDYLGMVKEYEDKEFLERLQDWPPEAKDFWERLSSVDADGIPLAPASAIWGSLLEGDQLRKAAQSLRAQNGFRSATSRFAQQKQTLAAVARRLKKSQQAHLLGQNPDLTKAVRDAGFETPTGLDMSLPRGSSCLLFDPDKDQRLTEDQHNDPTAEGENAVASSAASGSRAVARPTNYRLTLILMEQHGGENHILLPKSSRPSDAPSRADSEDEDKDTISELFPCSTDLQEAADLLLSATNKRRSVAHSMVIPCAYVNKKGEQEYVMVVNAQELEPAPYDPDSSILVRHDADEILRRQATASGEEVWYMALERLCMSHLLPHFLFSIRDKLKTGERLTAFELCNPPSDRLARFFKLQRSEYWKLAPQARQALTAFDGFCSVAGVSDSTLHSLRSILHKAYLLPGDWTPGVVPSVDLSLEAYLEALMDTGATADFVSQERVEKFKLRTRPCSTFVNLADSSRTQLTQQAKLDLVLLDPNGQPAAFSTWAYVLPRGCSAADVILGLPTLITRVGTLFLRVVKELVDKHAKTTEPERVGSDTSLPVATELSAEARAIEVNAQPWPPDVSNYPVAYGVELEDPLDPEATMRLYTEFAARHDADVLRRTWTTLDQEAPEDRDTPLPTDFGEFLHFSELGHDRRNLPRVGKARSSLLHQSCRLESRHAVVRQASAPRAV
jgi:hypothetical protein